MEHTDTAARTYVVQHRGSKQWFRRERDEYQWGAREAFATTFKSAAAAMREVLRFALETEVDVYEARVTKLTMQELQKMVGRFPEYAPCHCRAVRIMDDEADVTDEFGQRHTRKACDR